MLIGLSVCTTDNFAGRWAHKEMAVIAGDSLQHQCNPWQGASAIKTYSLPSINVNPRGWIKVNIYRGVNS